MTDVQTEPFFVMELVTPQRANELLERNDVNRPLRETLVAQYEQAMLRGEWMSHAGEPIYVSPDGRLLNGQHRLMAVARSGMDIELPFLYDAPEEIFLIADSGAKRSFADTLNIMGVHNAKTVASIVTILMLYDEHGRFRVAGGILEKTNVERKAYYEGLDPDEVQEATRLGKRTAKAVPPISASLSGGLWMLMRRVDPEPADAFFEAVITGQGLEAGSPALVLRRALANLQQRRHEGSTISPSLLAALFIKAFNYWRSGREVQQIAWRPGQREPFPKIEAPL